MEEWERTQPYTEATPSTVQEDDWELVDDGFHVEEEPIRVRESPGRFIAQIIFALIGAGVFAAMVLFWRDGTGDADNVQALWILLSLLLIILLIEVILLRPIFDALFRRVPGSLPVKQGHDNYIVGCPGCGTVFTVTEEDLANNGFACHNCGRHGYIKDYQLNHSSIREEECRTCGNQYLEYKDHSECPVCHTYNAY